MYNIYKTELFDKKFKKLIPLNRQEDILRRIENLANNPYAGKPLGYSFIREMKLDKYRVYYAVFERELVVLVMTVSDKKEQQKEIDKIKEKGALQTYFKKSVKFK
jgi:putative component of toxin-antitoxin plasmid stabilization module